MNNNAAIKSALVELMNALQDDSNDSANERHFTEKLVSKKRLSEILGLSISEIDRLCRAGVFIEGRHYTRYSDNGHKRFDVEECYKALKPERAGV